MKDQAIQNALNYQDGVSFSDGNMVVGKSEDFVAVAFNNTEHNQHQLVVLKRTDALMLMALLASALGYRVDSEAEAAAVRGGCQCNDQGKGQYHLPGCHLFLAPKNQRLTKH